MQNLVLLSHYEKGTIINGVIRLRLTHLRVMYFILLHQIMDKLFKKE